MSDPVVIVKDGQMLILRDCTFYMKVGDIETPVMRGRPGTTITLTVHLAEDSKFSADFSWIEYPVKDAK